MARDDQVRRKLRAAPSRRVGDEEHYVIEVRRAFSGRFDQVFANVETDDFRFGMASSEREREFAGTATHIKRSRDRASAGASEEPVGEAGEAAVGAAPLVGPLAAYSALPIAAIHGDPRNRLRRLRIRVLARQKQAMPSDRLEKRKSRRGPKGAHAGFPGARAAKMRAR